MDGPTGKIILINGASSAGKTTLARALQARLEEPFWCISIDHLREANMLPLERIRSGEFSWARMRPGFFAGFHRCLPELAAAGNNLIVEHIIETREWMSQLVALLSPFDVFFVGLHCPLVELERREAARGDRPIGDARNDFGTVHAQAVYDLELASTETAEKTARALIAAWHARRSPSALQTMRRALFAE